MPRLRRIRAKRRRVFVACEGESERGYAAFLSRLAEKAGLHLHLDIRICKGGDPLAIVEAAVDELHRRIGRRGAYTARAIFLDADRRLDVQDRRVKADRLIRAHGLCPIWSEPTFEAHLLRHLPGCDKLRPATSELALLELKKHWPDYGKGMPANELSRHLDLTAVRRAADGNDEFRFFLTVIGLLQ